MREHPAVTVIAALVLAAAPGLAQDGAPATAETSAEVPALAELHEVIYPLWHEAWPKNDAAMMKELLPLVQQHVARIEKVELPGILRDKQAAWSEQVGALRATATAYAKAAEANDTQALLDAVEALHARFERMVRLIRPVMKELDAYHQTLYRVYHKLMLEKKLAEMPAAAAELSAACTSLAAAPVPARFAAREAQLRVGFAELCAATETLKIACAGGGAETIAAAVERTHTAYQSAEKLFE